MTGSNCSGTLLLAVLLTAAFRVGFAQDVTFGNNSEGNVVIQSEKDRVRAKLFIRQVKLPKPGAYSGYGFVALLYEPASHLFWWTFQHTADPASVDSEKLRFLQNYSFAMDKSRIVAFTGLGRSVWVQASSAEASSITAAFETIDHDLKDESDQISSGAKVWAQQFNLSEVLGMAYFSSKTVKDIGGPAGRGLQVKSVARRKNGWRVEVANDYGDVRLVVFDDSLARVTEDSSKP
jgi:hypothetical protein